MPALHALDAAQWACAALAAACLGMSKSGFGGLSVAGILLMAVVVPVRESTGVILPMLIAADILAIAAFRRFTIWRHLLRILPPAFVGILVGWWLMPRIPDEVFAPAVGWLITALLAIMVLQKTSPLPGRFAASHRAVAWPLGLATGISTMLANAGGAVMTVYLLACRLPKLEFVGTAAWFFFVVNTIKVPFSASLGLITGTTLVFNLVLLPAIVVGFLVGRLVLRAINQEAFEWTLIVLTLAGSIRLALAG